MTAPAGTSPPPTRVDQQEVMHRLSQRIGSATAEAVVNEVALDAERAAHEATRAELAEARAELERLRAVAAADDTDGAGAADGDAPGGV